LVLFSAAREDRSEGHDNLKIIGGISAGGDGFSEIGATGPGIEV
jgi:hypothetical protein